MLRRSVRGIAVTSFGGSVYPVSRAHHLADLDRVGDRPGTGKGDQGLGLGDDKVTEHRKARGDPASRRVLQRRVPCGLV